MRLVFTLETALYDLCFYSCAGGENASQQISVMLERYDASANFGDAKGTWKCFCFFFH